MPVTPTIADKPRPSPREVRIFQTPAVLYEAAADEFARRANSAVAEKRRFMVALAGGSTPRELYTLLARESLFRERVPWKNVHFFWGDERAVPADHPDSNFHTAYQTMLSKLPITHDQWHRIQGEAPDAANAAADYELTLRQVFGVKPGELPRFDLILLGMGADGHTASLFPGSPALAEESRLVVANPVINPAANPVTGTGSANESTTNEQTKKKLKNIRITLTYPALNHAACVLFLVSGADKAATLREVLEGPPHPERLPAQKVRPTQGELLWFTDRYAAAQLHCSQSRQG